MRRFAHLTNAFSKKLKNCAVSQQKIYGDFARFLQALRMPPGVKAPIRGHVWRLEKSVRLAEN